MCSVLGTLQVREFQAIIGRETRQQCLDQFGGKPDVLVACVGGGSNAIGTLTHHVPSLSVLPKLLSSHVNLLKSHNCPTAVQMELSCGKHCHFKLFGGES